MCNRFPDCDFDCDFCTNQDYTLRPTIERFINGLKSDLIKSRPLEIKDRTKDNFAHLFLAVLECRLKTVFDFNFDYEDLYNAFLGD